MIIQCMLIHAPYLLTFDNAHGKCTIPSTTCDCTSTTLIAFSTKFNISKFT